MLALCQCILIPELKDEDVTINEEIKQKIKEKLTEKD